MLTRRRTGSAFHADPVLTGSHRMKMAMRMMMGIGTPRKKSSNERICCLQLIEIAAAAAKRGGQTPEERATQQRYEHPDGQSGGRFASLICRFLCFRFRVIDGLGHRSICRINALLGFRGREPRTSRHDLTKILLVRRRQRPGCNAVRKDSRNFALGVAI